VPRAKRVCAATDPERCYELVPPPHDFCPRHRRASQRAYDQERGTSAQRGYGAAWRRRRESFLARNPTCVDCGAPATDADHDPVERRELVARRDPDPDADRHLKARCGRCHKSRTRRNANRAAARAGRGSS
jgi:5-methylcytosine-specific restriction protein A